MKLMQVHYSDTADKPMIHINDLDSLKQHLMVKLGLAEEEFDSHVLLDWTDSVNEQTRRHCVNPLVHVLLSERATNLVADRTPFLPYVFTLESTPRNMDWVIVFYPAAFKRIQEFAFTENRKLLRLEKDNKALDFLKDTRFKFSPLPGGPADHILVFEEGTHGPDVLGLGDVYNPCEVLTLSRNGCSVRTRIPNALQDPGIPTGETSAPVSGDGLVVRDGTDATDKPRLLVVTPQCDDIKRDHVSRSTGRLLHPIMDAAKDSKLSVYFTQSGEIAKVTDQAGETVSLDIGVGKYLVSLLEWYSEKMIYVTPVGTQLRARAAALKADVKGFRRLQSGGSYKCQLDETLKLFHYPPYDADLSQRLGATIESMANRHGLVFVTDVNMGKIIALTDAEGEEITLSHGIGKTMNEAFNKK